MLEMINTMLIGAVYYTISDKEENLITAEYISSASMVMGPGKICRGEAEGDTSNGFSGEHVIRYYDANDELAGVYDWQIEQIGSCYKLTWRAREEEKSLPTRAGDIVFEGMGFAHGDRSMVVAYWFGEEMSTRMQKLLNSD